MLLAWTFSRRRVVGKTLFDLLNAHERCGRRVARRPHVLQDFLEVEMAVLGVDANPVVTQRDRQLADRGGLQRDPETIGGAFLGQFLFETVHGMRLSR